MKFNLYFVRFSAKFLKMHKGIDNTNGFKSITGNNNLDGCQIS